MVKGSVVVKRTAGRWLLAALTASAVLASGCAGPVDSDELPGVYRNEETGGEVVLDSDGTFSATHISMDESPGAADFSGTWDFVDSETTTDFVYLLVEDGGLGMTTGVQLYTGAEGKVYFHPDPDGPYGLVLTRTTAP